MVHTWETEGRSRDRTTRGLANGRSDVEQEIDDVLAWAPDNLTEKERKAVRDEVIAQTRHVTDALTTEELQNEGARRAYTCGALATTRQLINFRLAQTKRD